MSNELVVSPKKLHVYWFTRIARFEHAVSILQSALFAQLHFASLTKCNCVAYRRRWRKRDREREREESAGSASEKRTYSSCMILFVIHRLNFINRLDEGSRWLEIERHVASSDTRDKCGELSVFNFREPITDYFRCTKLQSNEEVIEELTKDLESSCIRVDENSTNVPSKTDMKSRDLAGDSWDIMDKEHNEDNNDNAQSTDFAEDIEEELKDRDLLLTESEKEALKCEAENMKQAGNEFFKNNEYVQAISQYTQGLRTCPLVYSKERSILYANRAAAKTKCQTENDSAISDCTKAIELNPNYVKAYIRRAQLYEETDKLDEALEDFKKVLTIDASHTEANHAIRRLPPLISERNEKLKTEMLGKLKELGNLVLKPFGLSTNNFELQQDPASGGYSVKFNQNPT